MLKSLGVSVTSDELTATLLPVESLSPLELVVPGDPSSAAYMVALGVLQSEGEVRIPDVCMNATRTGFFDAIIRMGGNVEIVDRKAVAGDEVGTLVVLPSTLHDTKVSGDEIPSMIDELPLLACVAAGAGVGLEVSDATELRVKESDRISTVVNNLKRIGADVSEHPDGFVVRPAEPGYIGNVRAEGDHRIAMSFGVLAALSKNSINIDDRDCVAVSYPRFWADIESIRQAQ